MKSRLHRTDLSLQHADACVVPPPPLPSKIKTKKTHTLSNILTSECQLKVLLLTADEIPTRSPHLTLKSDHHQQVH